MALGGSGCGDDAPPPLDTDSGTSETATTTGVTLPTSTTEGETENDTEDLPEIELYDFASGCYTVRSGDNYLAASDDAFSFGGANAATPFTMRASDLGEYLFYDPNRGFLVEESGPLLRQTTLQSAVMLADDTYVSGARWILERSAVDPELYQLRNKRTGSVLGLEGAVADPLSGAPITFEAAEGCAEFPELTLNATGQVDPFTFEDGSVYGIVDTHSHILSDFAFGGGGIFHGAAFHPLGVEHALPDCERYHGPQGRNDFFGFAFDAAGADGIDIGSLLPALVAGELDEDNHETAGYPEFTGWPNAPTRSTHQTQYYKWLERAHLAGLRLVVQHATTNSIICHMTAGQGIQDVRYSCEDMPAVDRIIEETYAMERYIDAQSGGPGEGWFRVVLSPAEAREEIAKGKMAVVLGIETSDLFNCRISPREGDPVCDEDYVTQQLDDYYARGVRVLFPVHKYDNAFSAGDGDRAFIELGNFFNSGHWGNFVENCPEIGGGNFDRGDVAFGGLNMPREDYLSPAPNDLSSFPDAPLGAAFGYLSQIQEPPLVGDYCQATGLTDLGEFLLTEMMARGMIIEIDHLPRRGYARAFEMLVENDYPAAGTHGANNNGLLYELGGVSKAGFGRCREEGRKGAMMDRFNERFEQIADAGGYVAEGFGFDLNGFAGAPGPRFAEGACADEQAGPVVYPFDSYSGEITFSGPQVGDRALDFNTEGMVHIGLLPELIEDARNDAESDADLEPIFRSAEGYIRMWEKSEARGEVLSGG